MLSFKNKFVSLYQDECQNLIPRFDDQSIRMVLTSPPLYFDDNKTDMGDDVEGYVKWLVDILELIRKPLSPKGIMYFHIVDRDNKHIPAKFAKAITENHWYIPRVIKWNDEQIYLIAKKEHGFYYQRNLGFGNIWKIPAEYPGIFYCRECHSFYDRTNVEKILEKITAHHSSTGFICTCGSLDIINCTAVMPEEVAMRCIQLSSQEWDIHPILDPFAGSGTTGVAARKLNRIATLIENNPRACELAEARFRKTEYDINVERFGQQYIEDNKRWHLEA